MSVAVLGSMEPLSGFANLSAKDLARVTHSAERTARKWIRARFAPRLIVEWLRLMFDRPLGMLCQRWEGWHLRNGKLHSPEGYEFTPEEVITIPLRLQQIAQLELSTQQQAAQLRREQERNADRQRAVDPPGSEPGSGRGNGLNRIAHCSLNRRQSVKSPYPSAETTSPTIMPSTMRDDESFTDV